MSKKTAKTISIIAGLFLLFFGLYNFTTVISIVKDLVDFPEIFYPGRRLELIVYYIAPMLLALAYTLALAILGIFAIIGLKKYILIAPSALILLCELAYGLIYIVGNILGRYYGTIGEYYYMNTPLVLGLNISSGVFIIITFVFITVFTVLTLKNVKKLSAFIWILPVITAALSAVLNALCTFRLWGSYMGVSLIIFSVILPNIVQILTVLVWCVWMAVESKNSAKEIERPTVIY